jgi:hypothetical protein
MSIDKTNSSDILYTAKSNCGNFLSLTGKNCNVVFEGPIPPYRCNDDDSDNVKITFYTNKLSTTIYDTPIPTMLCTGGIIIAIITTFSIFCK